MRKILVAFVALALLAPSVARSQVKASASYERPPTLNDGWQTASADSVGVDAAALERLTTTRDSGGNFPRRGATIEFTFVSGVATR
jgi:uncharacterized protein YdeI (BOF family)